MGYKKGETNYYVYLHRNKVTGEVFYVGKGKCRRAWECSKRSSFWDKTVKKYGRTVEIVLDNIQEWYAFEIEEELILKYGRRNTGTGILVNLSDGGEGTSGAVYTAEQRRMMSDRQKGELAHNFDRTVYKYYNIRTGKYIECLRSEFELKTKCQHDLTRTHHYRGWANPEHCTDDFIQRIKGNHSGKYSPHISNVIHNFVEVDTLKCVPMTVSSFIEITGKNPSNLLDKNLNNIRTLAGYTTSELIAKFTIEKIRARNKNTNIYSMTNVLTGCEESGTVEELATNLKTNAVHLNRLIAKNSITTSGWRLSSCTNKIPAYLVVHEFIHNDGRYFKGTRLEFIAEYTVDPAQLFRANNTSGMYKGWSLVK